jgi:hypothetical protein
MNSMTRLAALTALILTTVSWVVPDASAARWVPAVGTRWQWQLAGTLDLTVDAPIYDVDGFDTSAASVTKLHSLGRKVICYLDVGGAESYRPDIALIPQSVRGNTVDGWPQEHWIDIRQIALLQPMLDSRFNMCKTKGFDAIEPDLVDGYTNATGFPLTAANQIAYNNHLADMAHARGMSIALKNAPDIVAQEVPTFDFAIVEECLQYKECASYRPFIAAGKAVLHTEYKGVFPTKICAQPSAAGFSTMKKKLSLNAFRQACP